MCRETIPKTDEDKVDLLLPNAKRGLAWAQYALGVCYDRGQGVKQDAKKAAALFAEAAGQGHVKAAYNLGLCYLKGEGVKQDAKKAAALYEKAAAQGHVLAAYNLGVCYFKGQGVEQDFRKAAHWVSKAAAQGDSKAIELLPRILQLLRHTRAHMPGIAAAEEAKAAPPAADPNTL